MSVAFFLPWWAWLVLAIVLWFLQFIDSARPDSAIPENKRAMFSVCIRVLLIVAMIFCTLFGIIPLVQAVFSA